MPATHCSCDEAEQNRRYAVKGDHRWVEPTFPPNEDGELVCAFCWNVIGDQT